MINYDLMHYLECKEIKRKVHEKTKHCYTCSVLKIRYEEYTGRYHPNTFEYLLSQKLPQMHPFMAHYTITEKILYKWMFEYEVRMPIEMLPYFMEALLEIRCGDYPFTIDTERIIDRYGWADSNEH